MQISGLWKKIGYALSKIKATCLTLKKVKMELYKKGKKRVALDSSQFEDLNKNFLPQSKADGVHLIIKGAFAFSVDKIFCHFTPPSTFICYSIEIHFLGQTF